MSLALWEEMKVYVRISFPEGVAWCRFGCPMCVGKGPSGLCSASGVGSKKVYFMIVWHFEGMFAQLDGNQYAR